jgi:hypothetical protein
MSNRPKRDVRSQDSFHRSAAFIEDGLKRLHGESGGSSDALEVEQVDISAAFDLVVNLNGDHAKVGPCPCGGRFDLHC